MALEDRRLLAALYDNLSGYLADTLLKDIQTQGVAADAAKNPLPAIGTIVKTAAQSGDLLSDVSGKFAKIPDGITTTDQLAAKLQSLFPGAVTRNGTEFELKFDGTKTLSVDTFDLGLAVIGLSASKPFQINVGYHLDVTFGGNSTTGYYLNAAAANPELKLDLNLPNASLPDFQARLGVLYADAKHTTSGNALDLHFAIDVNGQKLKAADTFDTDARLEGAVDLNLDLTLRFQPASVTTFNPTLITPFHLGWNFIAQDTNVAYGQFGSPPTVEFRDVTLDLGSITKDFEVDPIVQTTRPGI